MSWHTNPPVRTISLIVMASPLNLVTPTGHQSDHMTRVGGRGEESSDGWRTVIAWHCAKAVMRWYRRTLIYVRAIVFAVSNTSLLTKDSALQLVVAQTQGNKNDPFLGNQYHSMFTHTYCNSIRLLLLVLCGYLCSKYNTMTHMYL